MKDRSRDEPDRGAYGEPDSAAPVGKRVRTERLAPATSGVTAATDGAAAATAAPADAIDNRYDCLSIPLDGIEVPYRAEMEAQFGTSFAGVKAHVGERAAMSDLGARGAARGETVAFADEHPSRDVVAHELTHVLQRRNAGHAAIAADSIVPSDHHAEVEARSIAAHIAAGGSVAAHEIAAHPGDGLHLDAGEDDLVPQAPTRTMRIVAYYSKKRTKSFVGNTRTELVGYYVAFRRGKRFVTQEGIDFTATRVLQKPNRRKDGPSGFGKPIGEWAGKARMVVIDLSGSVEDSIIHEHDAEQLGEEDGTANRASEAGEEGGVEGGSEEGVAEGSEDGVEGGRPGGTSDHVGEGKEGGTGTVADKDAEGGDGTVAHGKHGGESGDGTEDREGKADDGSTGSSEHDGGGDHDHGGDADRGKGTPDGTDWHDEPNAQDGGQILGEESGKSGGVYGGGDHFQMLQVPGGIAAVAGLLGVLSDADLVGLSDNLLKGARKLLKKTTRSGHVSRKALKEFNEQTRHAIEQKTKEVVEKLEQKVKHDKRWKALSKSERASEKARWSYEVRDHLERGTYRNLDEVNEKALREADELDADAELAELLEEDDIAQDIADAADTVRDEARVAEEARDRLGAERKRRRAVESRESPNRSSYKEWDNPRGGKMLVDPEQAEKFKSLRKHWTDEETFTTLKVYKRNDLIDPGMVDKDGLTNLQRMQQGQPPIGPDGQPMELHHLNQADEGPVVEVTDTFHSAHHDTLHINGNGYPSGIDRSVFDIWKRRYWKHRAKELAPK